MIFCVSFSNWCFVELLAIGTFRYLSLTLAAHFRAGMGRTEKLPRGRDKSPISGATSVLWGPVRKVRRPKVSGSPKQAGCR